MPSQAGRALTDADDNMTSLNHKSIPKRDGAAEGRPDCRLLTRRSIWNRRIYEFSAIQGLTNLFLWRSNGYEKISLNSHPDPGHGPLRAFAVWLRQTGK